MIAFLPTVTAVEAPPADYTDIPVFQQPGFHGQLIGRPNVNDRIADYLSGADLHVPRGEYALLQRLAAAWQAPGLAVSVNPAWRGQVPPGPRIRVPVCGGR